MVRKYFPGKQNVVIGFTFYKKKLPCVYTVEQMSIVRISFASKVILLELDVDISVCSIIIITVAAYLINDCIADNHYNSLHWSLGLFKCRFRKTKLHKLRI